jgi:hypothetical protein
MDSEKQMSALVAEENGWGSDDDILDHIDDDAWQEDGAATPITTNRRVAAVEIEGWDDDWNDLEDEEENKEMVISKTKNITSSLRIPMAPPPPPKTSMNNTSRTTLELELEEYIASIPAAISQVNRLLSREYNTREKAVELQHYYASRPQLLPYTLDKEFPRMEYTLRLKKNGPLLEDKAILAQLLPQHDNHSLCGRCANQSLLVDVLQALSSSNEEGGGAPNMAVLPSRFMATAIATNCHFTIDLPASTVHVQAQFQVSLPTPTTGRWILGTLAVTIDFFCPHPSSSSSAHPSQPPPKVEFRVMDWAPSLVPGSEADPSHFRTLLQQCASLLQEHLDTMDHFENENNEDAVLPSDARFRDAFLQRLSQSSIVATTEGFQSAWQDLDAATGLVSKLQTLPSLLPSPLDEAEEAAAMVAPRPTSLWGGLVRTIAQSLPSEPDVYDEPVVTKAVPDAPRLYNLRTDPPPNVGEHVHRLYNPPEPPPKAEPPKIKEAPQLYNRPEPPNMTEAPRVYIQHPEPPNASGDPAEGWDGDDDFWIDEPIDDSAKVNDNTGEDDNDVTNWVYDPVTDIIPTRTRWVNPIPGPRDLRYM